MVLVRRRPIRPLTPFEGDFVQDMNRFINEMRSWWVGEGEMAAWSPYVNVYRKDDQIFVEAEIPGMQKDQIEVSVQDDRLTLSGERKETEEIKESEYLRHERPAGSFFRSISLPSAVNAEKIDAKYENGVLSLTIPRAEEAKMKRIEIR